VHGRWTSVSGGGRAVVEVVKRVELLLPKVMAWHRYLARATHPARLLVVYHPWEAAPTISTLG
jgi:hypothetical protein